LENSNRSFEKLTDAIHVVARKASLVGLSLVTIENNRINKPITFGYKNARTKEKIAPDTLFEAGSLSKPVFAVLVLILVEKGLLDLDKPLFNYLKRSDIDHDFTDVKHDKRFALITARMALTHSTGFPNFRWQNSDGKLAIKCDPGSKFDYSAEGFLFLQKAVERITGSPLTELARRKLFHPLGMLNSTFVWDESLENKTACPHDIFGNPTKKNRPASAKSAYSLHTTCEDYGRFVLAVLQDKILTAHTSALMRTPNIRCRRSDAVFWGLGWGIYREGNEVVLWHWGDSGAAKSYVAMNNRTEKGFVFFANSFNGLSIVKELTHLIFAKPGKAARYLDYYLLDHAVYRILNTLFNVGAKDAIAPFLNPQCGARVDAKDLNWIGEHLLNGGHLKHAKDVFEISLQAFPSASASYYHYSEVCLRLGYKKKASAALKKLTALKPREAKAKRLISELCKKHDNVNANVRLRGFTHAKLVTIAGSFNNWDPFETFLTRTKYGWQAELDLVPGTYHYKLVVDGEWMLDPSMPVRSTPGSSSDSVLKIF
jgi:CubicO group peptidase (beta-lactamase class C family)